MLKPSLPAILIILTGMAALAACSGPTPETLTPTVTPAPTHTETPVPTEPPTERPTAAPTATPASSPIPAPTKTPAPGGRLAPLQPLDSGAMFSELSDAEKECIGENTERQTRYIGCLEEETLARIFLAGFVPGPAPLSRESSGCVRAAFEVIDPRKVMTAGIEGDPGRAMAGSMAALSVTVACLNDEEWEKAVPETGMSGQDREGGQCLMEALGGPGQMAEAILLAQEGDRNVMASAAAECGIDMGPVPGQTPPPPMPTATTTAPSPAPTPPATLSTLNATTANTPSATTATAPSPTETTTLVITAAEIPAEIPEYDRDEWKHWVDEDGDCQDARQEVLIAESLVQVTYEDDRQCRVATGRWWAPHLGHHLENPRHIDVDHHVPLKNAHISGGWQWPPERKEEYANYLGEENHLVAISARHNRSKGARGPEEWAPPDNDLWCDYATDWAEIKQGWTLTMTPREAAIVMDMLHTCEDPPEIEVETLDYLGTVTGEDKPTAESEETVYESCEEAATAGEPRVLGSRGGGKGFPAPTVPSARDGDGDGIVCER